MFPKGLKPGEKSEHVQNCVPMFHIKERERVPTHHSMTPKTKKEEGKVNLEREGTRAALSWNNGKEEGRWNVPPPNTSLAPFDRPEFRSPLTFTGFIHLLSPFYYVVLRCLSGAVKVISEGLMGAHGEREGETREKALIFSIQKVP